MTKHDHALLTLLASKVTVGEATLKTWALDQKPPISLDVAIERAEQLVKAELAEEDWKTIGGDPKRRWRITDTGLQALSSQLDAAAVPKPARAPATPPPRRPEPPVAAPPPPAPAELDPWDGRPDEPETETALLDAVVEEIERTPPTEEPPMTDPVPISAPSPVASAEQIARAVLRLPAATLLQVVQEQQAIDAEQAALDQLGAELVRRTDALDLRRARALATTLALLEERAVAPAPVAPVAATPPPPPVASTRPTTKIERILAYLRERGVDGAETKEIAEHIGGNYSSVTAQVSLLKSRKQIESMGHGKYRIAGMRSAA